jgi:hypothetical protein
MPKLNGKKYAYTKKGKEAYKKALMKKKKLKKADPSKPAKIAGLSAGQVVQATMLAKGAKKKDAGKMAVAGLATDYAVKTGKKVYNKVVDKINKKRGY